VAALGLPIIETHISYVLLGGEYAYKVKKAVNLEFLDFTTLEKRRFYCGEELTLNRRLAPSIYLDVVAITGSPGSPGNNVAPILEGKGSPLEYAVKMRQFDQDGLLSRVLARDELTSERVDEIAAEVASFHGRTARAGADLPYGRPEQVIAPARQNFSQMVDVVSDPNDRAILERLRTWTDAEANRCRQVFEARNRDGYVRECHGDLHLGNIALISGRVTLFDCIEFNPSMRWIDVMSDVAFLVMDLRDRKRPDLAARFLNAYLELTGDYAGLAVLRFYVTYRALVRAKIAILRLAQTTSGDDRQRLIAEYRGYLALAVAATGRSLDSARDLPEPVEGRPHPVLLITHGVTGSGKTTRAQAVVDSMGAIRIRSDVERKRLQGLEALARTSSAPGEGLYTSDRDRQTYDRLAELARTVVAAGYTAIVDAAFLQRWQRDLLKDVAVDLNVPFTIADCSAPEPVLRERVMRRIERGRDASEATIDILEHQLAHADPLSSEELALRQ
jgi:aminoglycoside phosphotransferase family enzyme/predicted kinase